MGNRLPTSSDTSVARASRLDTASISDALDRLGIQGQCTSVYPVSSGFLLAGRAWTLQYGPAAKPAGSVGDYIDSIAPHTVIVLDNRGRADCTVWGDILTEIAYRRGVAGTVINGINRDSALCVELGYPIFSRGVWMRTGKDRVQVECTGCPVDVGGVRVAPGDLLRGDRDGVLVIPSEHEEAVLTAAEEIQRVESQIVAAVREGCSLKEARTRFGYHSLQTRRDCP
jgi:4-hydroxy-4-methyl-2-oxoglutarate aldolase